MGAHTKGQNSVSYGIGFIGNYMTSNPSRAMIAAYERLQEVSMNRTCIVMKFLIIEHCEVCR